MHKTYVKRAANAGTRSNPSWSCCPGRTFWTSPWEQNETIMIYQILSLCVNLNPKTKQKNNKHFTREIWCSKTIEDLPSNALIWEGPTAPILPRNAVQRSELLGRKKQSLCCLCHQKLVSPCHHSFKKMGVQGIGGELVWLTWAQPLPYITGGSRFQNSEHHSVSLLEPTWKILSTTFDASASSAERWLNGKTAECCASHRGRWTAAWGALNCHPVAGELLGKTKGLDACGGSVKD